MATKSKTNRVAIRALDAADILIRSRRRCCLCYLFNQDLGMKSGQLAHIDRDHSRSTADNLAFLCLQHHNEYDGKHLQSKNLTPEELLFAREKLYRRMGEGIELDARVEVTIELQENFDTFDDKSQERVLDLIRTVLNKADAIRVTGKRRGSVHLSLEMSSTDAIAVLSALRDGKLESINAVDMRCDSIKDPQPDDFRMSDFSLETESSAALVFGLLQNSSSSIREYACAILGTYIEAAADHIQETAVIKMIEAFDCENDEWIRILICKVLYEINRPRAKVFLKRVDSDRRKNAKKSDRQLQKRPRKR